MSRRTESGKLSQRGPSGEEQNCLALSQVAGTPDEKQGVRLAICQRLSYSLDKRLVMELDTLYLSCVLGYTEMISSHPHRMKIIVQIIRRRVREIRSVIQGHTASEKVTILSQFLLQSLSFLH